MIVETEAYVGTHDLASHTRAGVTARNAVMWGPAGHAYVYLIYGVHHMFNVVTGPDGDGQAVLVRALEGRGPWATSHRVASGPGKLCRAMALDRRHSELDLARRSARLYITTGTRIAAGQMARGPRIGVAYAGAWAEAPLRFWIADHPAVSRR